MMSLVTMAVAPGGEFRLRPSTILELNRLAVDGLLERPGTYRATGIRITDSTHKPPLPTDVPRHVDDLCDYVASHWTGSSAVHLAAYILWRLNWIHPFEDGNGRTSRVVSYLVLCARLGYVLPGDATVPEIIANDKSGYYRALEATDRSISEGPLDLREMELLLENCLGAQLYGVVARATESAEDDSSTTADDARDHELVALPPSGAPTSKKLAEMEKKSRPRLFIGSSVEGLPVAEEIQASLDWDCEPTIWHQGAFGLMGGALESLVSVATNYDFAVLVLTPDDLVASRDSTQSAPRDNVIFELGLFIGALGRQRTFMVHPRMPMKLPTDLAGVTPATYAADRADGNLQAALGPFCRQLKKIMANLGLRRAS